MNALNHCEYRDRCKKLTRDDVCVLNLNLCEERKEYKRENEEITHEQIEREKYGDNWRDIK